MVPTLGGRRTRIPPRSLYLTGMKFEPCIPTRGTKVPAGPDWIHEIKYDGYRLIVVRDGDRIERPQGSEF
jgi:ATP-dependent DNA ligase